jgi:hypothetical protein
VVQFHPSPPFHQAAHLAVHPADCSARSRAAAASTSRITRSRLPLQIFATSSAGLVYAHPLDGGEQVFHEVFEARHWRWVFLLDCGTALHVRA